MVCPSTFISPALTSSGVTCGSADAHRWTMRTQGISESSPGLGRAWRRLAAMWVGRRDKPKLSLS